MAQNVPPSKELVVEVMRTKTEEMNAIINGKLFDTFKGAVQEQQVKTNSAEIPITIYTPVDVNKEKLVIFFHGGGWTMSSRKSHQAIVNILADATKTVWISVEYRIGPEHKYPIWLDDTYNVTRHVLENKVSYGVDKTAKIGVAGDSAGAVISASICHAIKNIDFQILVYGVFDLGGRKTPSFKEFVHPMYFITPEMLDWFISNAFRDEADMIDPRVSTLLSKSFDNLPPCLLIAAELDPLRDESYAYQKVLEEAGVRTKLVLIKGVVHGFFSLPGIFPRACAQVTDVVQEFIASV